MSHDVRGAPRLQAVGDYDYYGRLGGGHLTGVMMMARWAVREKKKLREPRTGSRSRGHDRRTRRRVLVAFYEYSLERSEISGELWRGYLTLWYRSFFFRFLLF